MTNKNTLTGDRNSIAEKAKQFLVAWRSASRKSSVEKQSMLESRLVPALVIYSFYLIFPLFLLFPKSHWSTKGPLQ